jgi:hypothetical protein
MIGWLRRRQQRKIAEYRAETRRRFAAEPQEVRDYWQARTEWAIADARRMREEEEAKKQPTRPTVEEMARSPFHGVMRYRSEEK